MPQMARSILVAVLPAIVILLAIQGLHILAKQDAANAERARYEDVADRATEVLVDRTSLIFGNLRNVATVVHHANKSGVSSTRACHDFINDTDMFSEFPSLRAIAVMEDIAKADLPSRAAAYDNDAGRAALGYGPLKVVMGSDGPRHGLITMLSPLTPQTQSEIGVDIFSRPRHETFTSAIDEGRYKVTEPFDFVIELPGAALFFPFKIRGSDNASNAVGETPVIFITAYPEMLLTGERPEPVFLIPKPYQAKKVISAVSQAIFFATTDAIEV